MAFYNRTNIGFLADFWKYWFCCFLPTFRVFWDFENLTFPTFMAAVTTFQLAQQVHTIVPIEDIKGVWKSVIWSHTSDWPCLKVVHKMEPTFFLGQRKYNFSTVRKTSTRKMSSILWYFAYFLWNHQWYWRHYPKLKYFEFRNLKLFYFYENHGTFPEIYYFKKSYFTVPDHTIWSPIYSGA